MPTSPRRCLARRRTCRAAFSIAVLFGSVAVGAFNRKPIAELAGLAPFNRDSGSLRGSRCIWGGAPRSDASCTWPWSPRCVPIRSSRAFTPSCARGKYPKSAPTPCVRKLLVILNAILHNETDWHTPALACATAPLSSLPSTVSEHGCC